MITSLNEYLLINDMVDLQIKNRENIIIDSLCTLSNGGIYYKMGCLGRKCKRCGIVKFLEKYKKLVYSKDKATVTWCEWKKAKKFQKRIPSSSFINF